MRPDSDEYRPDPERREFRRPRPGSRPRRVFTVKQWTGMERYAAALRKWQTAAINLVGARTLVTCGAANARLGPSSGPAASGHLDPWSTLGVGAGFPGSCWRSAGCRTSTWSRPTSARPSSWPEVARLTDTRGRRAAGHESGTRTPSRRRRDCPGARGALPDLRAGGAVLPPKRPWGCSSRDALAARIDSPTKKREHIIRRRTLNSPCHSASP